MIRFRISVISLFILTIYFFNSCIENKNKKIETTGNYKEICDSFSISMPSDVYSKYLSRLQEIDTTYKINFSNVKFQKDLKLNGKVKTFSEKEYSTFERNGKLKKSGYVKSQAYFYFNNEGYKLEENCDVPDAHLYNQKILYKYDSKLNLIEETWYEFGKLSRIYKYRYNEKNLKIERTFQHADGIIDFTDTYSYDDNSNLIEENHHDNEKDYLNDKTIYKYDRIGKLLGKIEYSSDSDIKGKEVFRYNDAGDLIVESHYDSEDSTSINYRQISKFGTKGNIIEKITIFSTIENKYIKQFDENGNLIFVTEFDNDSLHSKISYTYDLNNRLIEESLLFLESKYRYLGAYKTKYKYDTNGNLINEEWFNKDYNLYQKYIYQYDENGNLLNATAYNSKGDILSKYSYSYGNYDLNRNWLLKTLIINDKGESIFERKIEYY